MVTKLKNDAGVFNARHGIYKGDGKKYTFTHRNPSSGYLYGEDIPIANNSYGKWVSPDDVVLC